VWLVTGLLSCDNGSGVEVAIASMKLLESTSRKREHKMSGQALIAENVYEILFDLLGRKIEYYTDEGNWEEVYLLGFDSSSRFPHIEVSPLLDTTWGQMWHSRNPSPLPSYGARLKVTNPQRLRLLAVDAEQMKRISGDDL